MIEHKGRLRRKRKTARRKFWRRFKGLMECSLCRTPVTRDTEQRDATKATVDHIVPLALNGTNEYSNLRLLCNGCNSKLSKNILKVLPKVSDKYI